MDADIRSVDTRPPGSAREAIEILSARNRSAPDARLERRLIQLRRAAFDEVLAGPEPAADHDVWAPSTVPDPFPEVAGPPEVTTEQLSAEVMAGAVRHHGSLIVRSLLDPATAATLVDSIDRALEALDRWAEDPEAEADSPWFQVFDPDGPDRPADIRRVWVRASGSVWAAESPRLAAQIFDAYERSGLGTLMQEYFGEPAAVSLNKFLGRRVPPDSHDPAWHQDGSFLGDGVRTMNVWVALTECGDDLPTPGLDIVAGRVDDVLAVATDPDLPYIAIAPDVLAAGAGSSPTSRPHFDPGDALIFDDRLVHRTAISPDMVRPRYTVESWFFAPSHFPEGYPPLMF